MTMVVASAPEAGGKGHFARGQVMTVAKNRVPSRLPSLDCLASHGNLPDHRRHLPNLRAPAGKATKN